MICNTEVEISSGSSIENAWGDLTFTEAAPVVVAGHIGAESDATDKDGLTVRRARVRLAQTVAVDDSTVFRVAGRRWKPLSSKVSRNPQEYVVYNCQRLD